MDSPTLYQKTSAKKGTQNRMKLHSKTDIHTKTTQYVNMAVGWAGMRV